MIDPAYDIVVPTVGRPSLSTLLGSLANARGPAPGHVYLVDDRRDRSTALDLPNRQELADLAERISIIAGAGRGPAAARNRGWRAATAPWIAFLDDDVVVANDWRRALARDLAACDDRTAGTQGLLTVPLPRDRRPTDYERNVRGLEDARWITADCAYRREVLVAVDGFDERFPRAYREDADLALRITALGYDILRGSRRLDHPVRPADPWISVRLQAGNADDVLMRALHGPDWYERAGATRGSFRRHCITVLYAALAIVGVVGWAARTLAFAWQRIAPGPRDAREIRTMLLTSAVIPFAALRHHLAGRLTWRHLAARHILIEDKVPLAATIAGEEER